MAQSLLENFLSLFQVVSNPEKYIF